MVDNAVMHFKCKYYNIACARPVIEVHLILIIIEVLKENIKAFAIPTCDNDNILFHFLFCIGRFNRFMAIGR